ncbi:MAG: hypothetical protein FWG02_08665 [Holophagaceae bacterium]|nr:hypothetical protein [Holophagaceae bacterium]
MSKLFAFVSILSLTVSASYILAQGKTASVPLPSNIKAPLKAKTPEAILSTFLGIAFREDGAINEQGQYASFGMPDKILKEPGLNCSGFVLAASRFLLQKNISLATAVRDRLGDSGQDSALGRDWDFGWDLVLNISEGFERTLLLPGGKVADPAAGSGLAPLGYDLHSPETWQEIESRICFNHIYFVSLNRPTWQPGYKLLHYHVGILIRTSGEDWYIYHATKKQGVVRENLSNEQSRARFLGSNSNIGQARKHMFIVEVPWPVKSG